MRKLTEARLQLWPWSGFLLGGLGLILAHQLGADSNHDYCLGSGAPQIIAVCLLGLCLAGGGAFLSWRLWRRGEHHETATRRFIAFVSVMVAAVFAFAIVWPMVAALMIPRCFG